RARADARDDRTALRRRGAPAGPARRARLPAAQRRGRHAARRLRRAHGRRHLGARRRRGHPRLPPGGRVLPRRRLARPGGRRRRTHRPRGPPRDGAVTGGTAAVPQEPAWWRTPAAREGLAVGLVGLYGVSAGALGVAAGLSVWQTVVTSLLIFSGG